MKKQFLFSAIAVLVAVGGSSASTMLGDEYFPLGVQCEGLSTSVPSCVLGNEIDCTEDGLQYYYRPNGTLECLKVRKPDN